MRTCAVVLLALLAACSGGTAPDTPESLADELGCSDSFQNSSADELGVESAGECRVSGETVRLLMFASDQARDQFVAVAQGFGGRYVTGPAYAVEVQSAKAEADVRAAL